MNENDIEIRSGELRSGELRSGPSIPSIPSRQIFVGFYENGFKGYILCQLGKSDTYIATPVTFKNVLRYYWQKIRYS